MALKWLVSELIFLLTLPQQRLLVDLLFFLYKVREPCGWCALTFANEVEFSVDIYKLLTEMGQNQEVTLFSVG